MKIPNYNNKEIKVMMEYNYIPRPKFSKNIVKIQKMQNIIIYINILLPTY